MKSLAFNAGHASAHGGVIKANNPFLYQSGEEIAAGQWNEGWDHGDSERRRIAYVKFDKPPEFNILYAIAGVFVGLGKIIRGK